jgi:hypothetical protein
MGLGTNRCWVFEHAHTGFWLVLLKSGFYFVFFNYVFNALASIIICFIHMWMETREGSRGNKVTGTGAY